tara:strand:- start:52917 stop:53105 length:189 start_codon:yes stop_codon:yes gene_type:complete
MGIRTVKENYSPIRRSKMKEILKALQMQQTFEIEVGNYVITILGSFGVGMALMKMLSIANGG